MNKPSPIFYIPKRIFTINKGKRTPIIPSSNMSGQALVAVIAIMTFLSSLTLSSVDLVQRAASNWSNQISYEATIQIRPIENVNIEKALHDAVKLVKTFRGIQDAKIVDQTATEKLLEPWLGTGLSLKELPIPRLIIVTLKENEKINFQAISHAIKMQIPGGQFDDHHFWVNRFTTMAQTTVFIGFAILALILGSLILTIIFATRNALAENAHIINVLYFLGTETIFIAQQFDWHFFKTAFRGALYGGVISTLLFNIFSFWTNYNLGIEKTRQVIALFGNFSMSFNTYGKICILILCVAIVTTLTNRITILAQLKQIDQCENGLF
ncbi:Cell division protein [Bartonella clarridgeiae 73]|uniref:Cell division protein n=1 Tax=Bartonella clarridgeiae (strain CCUG 45776 / CIP 104772 / 73) TaxID=696125 RepID=E6YJC1_BARC7|nr:ABC transporter permease [Bartonella clarridgeiae]WCR55805.1 MAG: Cell-division-associated ABC-transporter-like signaling protein FtsX [Bartonella clarridgeiae]CBI76959.1 Cell division protein [Bartonella clarridgeiae 73]